RLPLPVEVLLDESVRFDGVTDPVAHQAVDRGSRDPLAIDVLANLIECRAPDGGIRPLGMQDPIAMKKRDSQDQQATAHDPGPAAPRHTPAHSSPPHMSAVRLRLSPPRMRTYLVASVWPSTASGSANAYSASTAATIRYCLPSSMNVCGAFETSPSRTCQSMSPVAAS